MKPVILKANMDNEDTIVFKNYAQNGCVFWNTDDTSITERLLARHEATDAQAQKLYNAVQTGEGDPVEGSQLLEFALNYCINVDEHADMRQVIVDSKDPQFAYRYCRDVAIDSEMRQLVLDGGDAMWAYWWCMDIEVDSDMYQMIIDTRDPQIALYYCQDINRNDENMRQLILDTNDPRWIHLYNRLVDSVNQ